MCFLNFHFSELFSRYYIFSYLFFMKLKSGNESENLQPVSINITDSKYTPLCFIDSANFREIMVEIIPILFFAIVFLLFSFRQSLIPFEYIDETFVDHNETKNKLDIDFSIYNLSTLHKFLKIKFYAAQSNELNNSFSSDDPKKLNISIRYVFQKNYEVIDSNTSLYEEVFFVFNNSNISQPLHLFQHVVDLFDYINIHLYMNGNFLPFDKFMFKYTCINSATDFYFDQTLLSGSLLCLILLLFFSPKKLTDKKLKVNLIFMILTAIFLGIPQLRENRYKLFSAFSALLRYFLLSQIYMIYTGYQSNFVYLIFFIFTAAISNFEYKSFEKRYEITFLPIKQQNIILNEERYMMICTFIYAIVLLSLIAFVSIKEKEVPTQRFRYLLTASLLVIISSFYYQIISVYNLQIIQTSVIMVAHFIIFFTIGGLSFILFGPVCTNEYRSVDDYDTNLAVDPISDDE